MTTPLRVVIADDQALVRTGFRMILAAQGMDVVAEAETGTAAVQAVRRTLPDVVLMDIRMPEMDGIEALGKILSRDKKIPIIIYTAYSNYKSNFMTWTADAYVTKSSNLDEIKGKVREILAARA